MTGDETRIILAKLRGQFPHSFNKLTFDDGMKLLEQWKEAFLEDDAKEVQDAIEKLITGEALRFAPTISQVKAQMAKSEIDMRWAEYESHFDDDEECGLWEHDLLAGEKQIAGKTMEELMAELSEVLSEAKTIRERAKK